MRKLIRRAAAGSIAKMWYQAKNILPRTKIVQISYENEHKEKEVYFGRGKTYKLIDKIKEGPVTAAWKL
jgi:hypothetical protein